MHVSVAEVRGEGGGGDCSFKQPEDGINSPLRTRARSGDAQAHDVRDLAAIASQPRIKTNWNFQHIHMNQPIFFYLVVRNKEGGEGGALKRGKALKGQVLS